MPEVVAVLLVSYDRGYLDAVDGLNRYRDQHLLDWDIRIISHGSGTKVPSDAWWVIPAGVLLHHLPKERKGGQVIAFTGKSTDHSQSAAHFDDQVFGHLAARHLFERGYRHFAAVEGIQHERLQSVYMALNKRWRTFNYPTPPFPVVVSMSVEWILR